MTTAPVPESTHPQSEGQFVTFYVGKMYFGVAVSEVQEIIRHQPMTPVPLAPNRIRGLVNLRGQIITAIDMRSMLGLVPFEDEERPMNVVINIKGEVLSFLVDRIGEVLEVERTTFESPPETVGIQIARIINGVHKLENDLLLLVDTSACLTNGH
jgi:purine-binding chemotaxis protein CheW